MTKIYVRVFSEEYWFGAWAPVDAIADDKEDGIFIITENNLTEDDEYEFFKPGTEVRVEKFTDEHGREFLGATEVYLQSANRENGYKLPNKF
ncbi:MAG: hypothetical protein J5I98_29305 [Phaeodactylibacter sp.]|nr:hypothetical protein [Phaeodactylibacter sp.]